MTPVLRRKLRLVEGGDLAPASLGEAMFLPRFPLPLPSSPFSPPSVLQAWARAEPQCRQREQPLQSPSCSGLPFQTDLTNTLLVEAGT